MGISNAKDACRREFSLSRVLIQSSLVVASMVSAAALLARIAPPAGGPREWSLAGKLAAEKIAELNRLPANDPRLAVTAGKTAGSLTSDVSQEMTAGPGNAVVAYHDEVVLGREGTPSEAVKGSSVSDTAVPQVARQKSRSVVSAGSNDSTTMTFKRRWLIQKDVPVRGVNRVTVLVSLEGIGTQAPITYQLSTARP